MGTGRPAPELYVHSTAYRYDGDADPSRPGGMTTIYRHLVADEQRARQVIADVLAALSKDRNCLVLTNRTSHLEKRDGRKRPPLIPEPLPTQRARPRGPGHRPGPKRARQTSQLGTSTYQEGGEEPGN